MPGRPDAPTAILSGPVRVVIAACAILAIAAVLTIHKLGAVDVCGGNEGIEAVFVQQMVEHHHVLFPLENGAQPMYKPPLFHWTATALDRIAGARKVTAFNLRLPTALYAILGVALTMGFAGWMLGGGGALIAGLVLVGSYQYITLARIGRVDMTLAFFETLALFAFVWWMARHDADGTSHRSPAAQWLLYLLGLALGLAVLAKGPVGAILPLLAMVIFLVAERRAGMILEALSSPGAVVLALAVGSSWYLACFFAARYGVLNRQFGSENFGRFFGALGTMAPWYYVVPLLLNSAPLSLLAVIAVIWAFRTYRHRLAAAEEARADAAMRLFAIFYVVTVVFFSIAAYKRRAYLLPLWPACAVMLAWWLGRLAASAWGRRLRTAVVAICLVLVIFNFFFIPHREVRECGGDSYRTAAAEIDRAVARNEPLYSYGFTDEIAPLLFYLDRNAPRLDGRLADAPPGYVIVPAAVWAAKRDHAPGMAPVLTTTHGEHPLVLLHHGRIYAGNARPRG